MSRDLALGQSKEPCAAATDVMDTRGLRPEMHSVTILNSSLSREQRIVVGMSQGIRAVLKRKKPGLAAFYLHRQQNRVRYSEEATLQRQIQDDLEDVAAISVKNSFPVLPY